MKRPAPRPIALVTGASRGIGRAIARSLAGDGYDIAGNATRDEHLESVRREIQGCGADFLPVAGDVGDLACHADIVHRTLDRFGRIDLLVNNAGVAPGARVDLLETTPESFDRVLRVNARGAFFPSAWRLA